MRSQLARCAGAVVSPARRVTSPADTAAEFPTRRLFVAGANGATGRTLQPLAEALDIDLTPHIRPATATRLGDELPKNAAIFDLNDDHALKGALSDRTTVVQLIGTMRKRFGNGDTYASSDIATTRSLVDACPGTAVDHIVLLSSVGAGKPKGAYLQAKAEAEKIVVESGVPYTIFRPSAFIGAGHSMPWGVTKLLRTLAPTRYWPIAIEDLARTILWVARNRSHLDEVLEGGPLWGAVETSGHPG